MCSKLQLATILLLLKNNLYITSGNKYLLLFSSENVLSYIHASYMNTYTQIDDGFVLTCAATALSDCEIEVDIEDMFYALNPDMVS